MNAADKRGLLFRLSDALGPVFGSEDLAVLLYSLVRMTRPKVVVELGTGIGVSSFWMAAAASMNDEGMVYTVDDLTLMEKDDRYLPTILEALRQAGMEGVEAGSPEEYLRAIADLLEVSDHLTVVKRTIDLEQPRHFDDYPFGESVVDLVFSDFSHSPEDIIGLLAHFLPRMADRSSIIIDSAPTAWAPYLLVERLAADLNCGRVPIALREQCASDLSEVMRNRKVSVMHLAEHKPRKQNACSWIQLSPLDVRPYSFS